MFGIGSKKGDQNAVRNTTPTPIALKQIFTGLFRRGTQILPAQVRDGDLKPQKRESMPLRSAFEAGNLNAVANARSLRAGNTAAREGTLLRTLQNSLVQIETAIAKENDRTSPNQDRLKGLKTLWAQDHDEMFAMMKAIRDRESKGLSVGSAVSPPPQVRSLGEFNEAKGSGAADPVNLDANEALKKMSELREKVELTLASATDGPQKRDLKDLMSDIDKKVLNLTQKALGG